VDIARLFSLQIRIKQKGDIKKSISILHGTLAFVISMTIIMGLIIDKIIYTGEPVLPRDETVGQLVAKGLYHLVDVIIIVSYIYLYREIRDQYSKIRSER